jgi:ATP-dependent protease ClpP protease subunit
MAPGGEDASGEVCYGMAMRFLKNLRLLEDVSSEQITVILNTAGGDVYQGLAIYDAIKLSPCPIVIEVHGLAMSMGAIILQAADSRRLMPSAAVMFHCGHDSGPMSNPYELANYVLFGKKMDAIADRVIYDSINEKRSKDGMANLSPHKFKAMLLDGVYLTAKEAVDMGLADEIIGS